MVGGGQGRISKGSDLCGILVEMQAFARWEASERGVEEHRCKTADGPGAP